MQALLLIAHGSRIREAAHEVEAWVKGIQTEREDLIVLAAFLEITHPLIEEGIEKCIKLGATHIVVLPLFLNSGSHVTRDIPKAIRLAGEKFKNIQFDVMPHIGAHLEFLKLIQNVAKQKVKMPN